MHDRMHNFNGTFHLDRNRSFVSAVLRLYKALAREHPRVPGHISTATYGNAAEGPDYKRAAEALERCA